MIRGIDLLTSMRKWSSTRRGIENQRNSMVTKVLAAINTTTAGRRGRVDRVTRLPRRCPVKYVIELMTQGTKASRQNNVAIIRDWCYPRIP